MPTTPLTVALRDGRRLECLVLGREGDPLLVNLNGTPSGHDLMPAFVEAAAAARLRVVSIARPGYAGSSRLAGRTVADVVPDVHAVLDHLGARRYAVVGSSGGGPHALACGALSDRCVAVATVAGVAPWGAPGLDFLAGMGEGNDVEFAAALEGEAPLRVLLEQQRVEMVEAGPAGTYAAMESVLSPPDRAVWTGELADRAHASMSLALRDGVDGWLDDDLAFTADWGFGLDDVTVPVFLWQGEQDLMVPPAHGRWLASALPACTARILPDDGHVTLGVSRPQEVLADLAAALRS